MKKYCKQAVVLGIMVLLLCGCSAQGQKDAKETAEQPCYIAEGIRKISVTSDGEEILQISYEPEAYESSYEYWKIRVPYGEEAIVDTEAVLNLYHHAEGLEFQEVSKIPEDTGLTGTKTSITLEFCQAGEEERAAAIDEQAYEGDSSSYEPEADSTCTLLIGSGNGNGHYYTALEAYPEKVYLMPEAEINALLQADPFDLILKISTAADINTMEQITINMDRKEYQLTVQDEGCVLAGKELKEADWHKLYTELFGVLVAGEVEDTQKLSADAILEFSFKRKADMGKDLEIAYHDYDDGYASVCVNGVETFLVKKADVEQLKKTIRTYL